MCVPGPLADCRFDVFADLGARSRSACGAPVGSRGERVDRVGRSGI